MTPVLIGVDVGTTRTKAVVVETDGTECDLASRHTPWRSGATGTEVDANELSDVAAQVIADAFDQYRQRHPRAHVVGVGVTGMAESGLIVDHDGTALTPIIAWHDPRGATDAVASALPDFSARTGLRVGPVASIMKLPHLLDLAGRTAQHWLNVPEWIVFRLGGERFCEISLASRTGLIDVRTKRWWVDGFEFLGRTTDLMATDPRPGVLGAGTAKFDPIRGARLVVAGHDHQVAAYGEGALVDDRLFNSVGTADAVIRATTTPPTDELLIALTDRGISFGCTVIDDHWVALAGLRTGQMLERAARLLGVTDRTDRIRLSTRAAAIGRPVGLTVRFDGDRMSIDGIADGIEPAHVWRATVESADQRLGQALEILDQLFGPTDNVTVAGGWLNDPAVLDAKRRRFGTLRIAATAESGAVGAALMAGVSAGACNDPPAQHPRATSGMPNPNAMKGTP